MLSCTNNRLKWIIWKDQVYFFQWLVVITRIITIQPSSTMMSNRAVSDSPMKCYWSRYLDGWSERCQMLSRNANLGGVFFLKVKERQFKFKQRSPDTWLGCLTRSTVSFYSDWKWHVRICLNTYSLNIAVLSNTQKKLFEGYVPAKNCTDNATCREATPL